MNRYCLPFAGKKSERPPDSRVQSSSANRVQDPRSNDHGRTDSSASSWKWAVACQVDFQSDAFECDTSFPSSNRIAACIEVVAGACVSELQRKHGSTRSNIQIEDEQATNLTHVANATQAAHAIPTATFPTFQKPASCLHPNFVQPSRCRTGEVARSNAK